MPIKLSMLALNLLCSPEIAVLLIQPPGAEIRGFNHLSGHYQMVTHDPPWLVKRAPFPEFGFKQGVGP